MGGLLVVVLIGFAFPPQLVVAREHLVCLFHVEVGVQFEAEYGVGCAEVVVARPELSAAADSAI